MKVRKKDYFFIFLFLLPATILFLTFFILPVFNLLGMSVKDSANSFIGFDNYNSLFTDNVFQRSIRNNVVWAFVASFIQVPLAIVAAVILSQKIKGWKIFRTIYFLPQVISGVALATLWSAIFNAQYGLLNGFLELIGRSDLTRNWLGTLETAFPAILSYWVCYIGYYMVIILADIQSIPEDFYEAARIDGAGKFRTAISITIPLVKGSIASCITLAAISGFRQFEQVYLLTNGGPANRTSVMVLYLYNKMQLNEYAQSSAAAIVLIVIGALVVTIIRRLLSDKDE